MRRRRLLAGVSALAALVLVALGPAADASALVRPVDGPVVRGFTAKRPYGPGRRAIVFAVVPPTPVRAVAPGSVTFAGVVAGVRYVTIEHAGGVVSTYGHLLEARVRPGSRVATGALIGTAAAASRLTAGVPALTFSLRVDGAYVDPLPWFRQRPVHLVA